MMRMKSLINRYNRSLRFRMLTIVLGAMSVLMLINIYNYLNINDAINSINNVYVKNFSLNELKDELIYIQSTMTDYLKNKNTDSMEDYYRHIQIYQNMLEELNDKVVDEEFFIMEKNIRNMSQEYIECTDKAIEYKRGRNVEGYKLEYIEAGKINDYLTTYINSLNSARFRANSLNHKAMISVLAYTQKMSIIVFLAVTTATIVLIYIATSRITFPLRRLAATADIVSKGKLDVEPVEITTHDEVQVVTTAFNKMLFSIREYIERMTENLERERAMQEKELLMDTHLKEAQLNYLQAQINPHFLFNTLNAGAQLAMMEDAERTYEYIQNVADFYRYNIAGNKFVSLKDELELVDNYMYIINVRFSGDIKYTKDVDETVTSVLVPSMILQPVIENSVRYGVHDIEWEARINMSVTREEAYVCIKISDNGVGMTEETINKILNEKAGEEKKKEDTNVTVSQDSNGIGLRNVIARLRLYYGVEDVIEIYSEGINNGTQVTLLIPYN